MSGFVFPWRIVPLNKAPKLQKATGLDLPWTEPEWRFFCLLAREGQQRRAFLGETGPVTAIFFRVSCAPGFGRGTGVKESH